MNQLHLSRRQTLVGGLGLGLSLSFLGGVDFAAADGDLARRKLVVIVCRGAMDGLSVAVPVGDPNYVPLRRDLAIAGFGQSNGALKFDRDFGLHPKLDAVHQMAMAGEVRIAPAVATPDRARSHFEAQDVLETGANGAYRASSGWLNRSLQAMAPGRRVTAMAVGDETPLILRGQVQTASWSPGIRRSGDPRLPSILLDLYKGDPLLGPALSSALETQTMASELVGATAGGAGNGKDNSAQQLGLAAGKLLAQPGGPSVMAISLYGFDSHHGQGAAEGLIGNRLVVLDGAIDGLKQGLGPAWKDTVVLAVTEFGRTARANGTGGTDHGTASTALIVGGATRAGSLVGDWPTLQEARLFQNRDLAPTLDMRSLFKGVLTEHFGIERAALDTIVFPDSAGVQPYRGIVA